jgi:hypothetical protein
MKFFGGGSPNAAQVKAAREVLGIKDGEFLSQDVGAEAAKILGRKTDNG